MSAETACGTLVEARGLTKHYDGFSLEDVDLTVSEGEVVGFVGQNGAGKSTTIKALLGLFPVDGGASSVLGVPSERLSRADGAAAKERVGVVFDAISLPEHLRVADVGSIYARAYATWDGRRFERLASEFGLDAKKTVKDLSRGMGMKLSLACALAHDARLLVLDEATAGMDALARRAFWDTMHAEAAEGRTLLFATHYLTEARKEADRIVIIDAGKVLVDAPTEQVVADNEDLEDVFERITSHADAE